jgi:hypothetical protein
MKFKILRYDLFAIVYLGIVFATSGWAFYVDATLLNSQLEHLAPDLLVFAVTFPASYSGILVYDTWPDFFSGQFIQLGWSMLCGVVQACLLFITVRALRRPKR